MVLTGNPMEWFEPPRNTLPRALLISVIIHLVLLGSWQLANRYGWATSLSTWLQPARVKTDLNAAQALKPPMTDAQREVPLMFIDVDPALAVAEPPKDARYYSSQSTKAANPEPTIETGAPKIDGTQTRVPKTFDTLRPQPPQAVPEAIKPAQQREVTDNSARPAGGREAGNTVVAKPELKPGPTVADATTALGTEAAPRVRPRTILAAKAQKGLIQGERMKQEGGTRQRGQVALDVRGTPFGAYDAAIVAAIQKRWYDLLDERNTGVERVGKVMLEFRLNYDGRVTNLRINETDVGDYLAFLCQKAVEDPAPYAPWPSDMRRLNRADFREVRFTFYYN